MGKMKLLETLGLRPGEELRFELQEDGLIVNLRRFAYDTHCQRVCYGTSLTMRQLEEARVDVLEEAIEESRERIDRAREEPAP